MNNHYDPNQPRNSEGEWTDAGVAIQRAASDKKSGSYKPSKEEIEAIKEYTDSKYAGINRYLRKGINPTEEKLKMISNIENFINKSPKVEGESYRGLQLGMEDYFGVLKKAKVGATLTDNGFVSTSVQKLYAENFTGHSPYTGRVIMKIQGNKGVYLGKGLTGMEDEQEILYNRGTKFKVLESKEENIAGRATLNLLLKQL